MSYPISIIIKVTEDCNYRCDFCVYTRYLSKKRMTRELCEKTILKAACHNEMAGYNGLHIIFHGGEPLLRGKEFYEDIFNYIRIIKGRFKDDFKFSCAIQTNGYLLDDEWIRMFRNNDVDIGVSIDGPIGLNQHKINDESEKTVLNNIKKLNKSKVRFGIISVITNNHYNREKEYYDFLVDNNIKKMSYNLCFDRDGVNTVDINITKDFLCNFFDLYFDGEAELSVKDFDIAINSIVSGDKSDYCSRCGRLNCGQYLTIDCDGRVFFCDRSTEKSESLGSITNHEFEDIMCQCLWVKKRNAAKIMMLKQCSKCEVKKICGGGCYRHDLDGRNVFCEAYKHVYLHIEKRVKEIL